MQVSELNKLVKMQRQMGDMMKKMGKGGMLKQAMKGMFDKGGGLPAGMDPSQMDPKALEATAKQMGASGGLGSGLPGLGGGMALPPGLSGFGKKK
jgi:signal recognition particle subunit SRP54